VSTLLAAHNIVAAVRCQVRIPGGDRSKESPEPVEPAKRGKEADPKILKFNRLTNKWRCKAGAYLD